MAIGVPVVPALLVPEAYAKAGYYNTNVRDAQKFFSGGQNSIYGGKPCFMSDASGVAQNAANGIEVVVNTVASVDTFGGYGGAGLYTCALAGFYEFTAAISFVANATGLRYLALNSTGSGAVAANWIVAADDTLGRVSVVMHTQLAVGQTVKMSTYQTSGITLATVASSTFFNGTWLSN